MSISTFFIIIESFKIYITFYCILYFFKEFISFLNHLDLIILLVFCFECILLFNLYYLEWCSKLILLLITTQTQKQTNKYSIVEFCCVEFLIEFFLFHVFRQSDKDK